MDLELLLEKSYEVIKTLLHSLGDELGKWFN